MTRTASKLVVVALTALATVAALTVSAAAQDAPKVKEIDFEEDFIEGELQLPPGINIDQLEERDLITLVRARADFTADLLVDVEDL